MGVALYAPVWVATLRLEGFPFILVAAPGKTLRSLPRYEALI